MFEYMAPDHKKKNKSQVQKKSEPGRSDMPNRTGIPDATKTRFENLSGFSFADVRVHYNSDKPAQLQAMAYTQGNQVYVAPGQEHHLAHELGHVVQQKEGRVRPTLRMNGVGINNDSALESEADAIAQSTARYYKDAGEEYNNFYGVTQRKSAVQGRFGNVIQAACYWKADEFGNVIDPVPEEADPGGTRWIKELGNAKQRMYNSSAEAKAAATVAVGVSFAKKASDDNAEEMIADRNAGFEAIRDSYGEDVAGVSASNENRATATNAVNAFGVVNEKLNVMRTKIFGKVKAKYLQAEKATIAQKAHAIADAQTAFTDARDAAVGAVAADIQNIVEQAIDNADNYAIAEIESIPNDVAPADKHEKILKFTAKAITRAFYPCINDVAAYCAKTSGVNDGQKQVAKFITGGLLRPDYGAYRYNLEQSDQDHPTAAYEKGIGKYHYYKTTTAGPAAEIKKGTPVVAKHTNDPTLIIKKRVNGGAFVSYKRVHHWHAGIVNENEAAQDPGEQHLYKQAGDIEHYIIKPTEAQKQK